MKNRLAACLALSEKTGYRNLVPLTNLGLDEGRPASSVDRPAPRWFRLIWFMFPRFPRVVPFWRYVTIESIYARDEA